MSNLQLYCLDWFRLFCWQCIMDKTYTGAVPTFNSCTICQDSPGKIHFCTPDCRPASWTWMTSQLNIILIHQLCGSFSDVLSLFSDMLSMGVCTTKHWQMSGRLVQELNVCTVHHIMMLFLKHMFHLSTHEHLIEINL